MGHSGRTPRLHQTPNSIRYPYQRIWGQLSGMLRAAGSRKWSAPTSGFTLCTATCGKLWFWRKVTVPTYTTVTCWFPSWRSKNDTLKPPSMRGGRKGSGVVWWRSNHKHWTKQTFSHTVNPLWRWPPLPTWDGSYRQRMKNVRKLLATSGRRGEARKGPIWSWVGRCQPLGHQVSSTWL